MFILAEKLHKGIYELAPDVFGNSLTPEEIHYWNSFWLWQAANHNGIDVHLPYDCVIEELKTRQMEKEHRHEKQNNKKAS